MPRTTAKARRLAHAARIIDELLRGGGTRLVIVDESAGPVVVSPPDRDLGGWGRPALVRILEAELRPGQRRRTA